MSEWTYASVMVVLKQEMRTLHPAYFAMVMATGIVGLAATALSIPMLGRGLSWLNILFFSILSASTLLRVACYPRDVWNDVSDHNRGVGFFTIVAGVCILAGQLLSVDDDYRTAGVLWLIGTAFWVILIYLIFFTFTVKERKPSLAQGINGGWLVTVVSTQAVANLGTLLASRFGTYEEPVLFFALVLWLFGSVLYIWLTSLIFYRYMFFSMEASDLLPPYWINMGAAAISTLTGTTLIAHASRWHLLEQLLPFLFGFTVLFWATATWWIPMLIIFGFWRHFYKKVTISYGPQYWSLVFPLGMYTFCTFQLAEAAHFPALQVIPRYFIYVAAGAWACTFAGLVCWIVKRLRQAPGGMV